MAPARNGRAANPEPSIWTRPPAAPPRASGLTRDAIVQAAIAVVDAGGVEALTMQAVAQRLGDFTPMALYRHVFSKDNLIDLMLDHVLGEVSVPSLTTLQRDWAMEVYALEMGTWLMVLRHPWYAQLVHTRPPLGPRALARTEFLLTAFEIVGANPGQAMGYVSLLERLVIGMALQIEQEARAGFEVDMTEVDAAYTTTEPLRALLHGSTAYPRLQRWAEAPSGPTPTEQFDLGLNMLLEGIAERHHAEA